MKGEILNNGTVTYTVNDPWSWFLGKVSSKKFVKKLLTSTGFIRLKKSTNLKVYFLMKWTLIFKTKNKITLLDIFILKSLDIEILNNPKSWFFFGKMS